MDRLKVLPQYLLPRRRLTRLAGRLANAQAGRSTQVAIRRFIARYGVNMAEAANPDPASYATFNEFFTRPLREGVRPLARADFICPVDGAISQFGDILGDQVFQAKGHHYSTLALLGGDAESAQSFQNGQFATIYLSPRDYHRIHMPCEGQLRSMTFVPGDLFSVNPATARAIPGLFARNERLVCVFDTPHGPMALVLVGATIVGSMATVWHGVVNPLPSPKIQVWDYAKHTIALAQGEEMGRFLLGSTVVLLWPQGVIQLNPEWTPGAKVFLGSVMGLSHRNAIQP